MKISHPFGQISRQTRNTALIFAGKRLGTIGDAGALSFNYYKIITAGEGGALLTDDKTTELFCGNEYRTNGISAAILREQLKRMDGILSDLRTNKKYVMDAR